MFKLSHVNKYCHKGYCCKHILLVIFITVEHVVISFSKSGFIIFVQLYAFKELPFIVNIYADIYVKSFLKAYFMSSDTFLKLLHLTRFQ